MTRSRFQLADGDGGKHIWLVSMEEKSLLQAWRAPAPSRTPWVGADEATCLSPSFWGRRLSVPRKSPQAELSLCDVFCLCLQNIPA